MSSPKLNFALDFGPHETYEARSLTSCHVTLEAHKKKIFFYGRAIKTREGGKAVALRKNNFILNFFPHRLIVFYLYQIEIKQNNNNIVLSL